MRGRNTFRPVWNRQRLADDLMEKGWSQAELALRAGVTTATVSRFMTGQPCGLKQVRKMAAALRHSHNRYRLGTVAIPDAEAQKLSA